MFLITPPIFNKNKNASGKCEKVDWDFLLNTNEKNYKKIVCRRCNSIVFPPNVVIYVEKFPVKLPQMSHEGEGKMPEEVISWWWYTNDDLDFDTIGWQTIKGKRFVLMCGDCEFGPIGFRTDDNKHFYVAVERMNYLEPAID
ncbi:unnamed protein product, partial [Mesorhabditis belari]|uniref:Mss4-like protein n=1 Tax=Mesorhabditis belari TaxID=2138241 RepID=A0AAF3EQ19_9BILA